MRVMDRGAQTEMITEQAVLGALATIKDPDLRRDIVSLGFVKGLRSTANRRLHDRADDAGLSRARPDEGTGAPRRAVAAGHQARWISP